MLIWWPETKGRSLEDIGELFGDPPHIANLDDDNGIFDDEKKSYVVENEKVA